VQRNFGRQCFCLGVGLWLSTFAPSVRAGPTATDRETARTLMDEGDRLAAKADYGGALKAYVAADALMGVPTTGFSVARAYELSGQLVEAHDKYLAVARSVPGPADPTPFARAREAAKQRALDIDPRIPSLRVLFTEEEQLVDAEVEVDGVVIPSVTASLPRRANPGRHRIAVRKLQFAAFVAELQLVEGERRVVEVTLQPAAVAIAPASIAPPASPPDAPASQPKVAVKAEPAVALVSSRYPTWGWYGLAGAGVFTAVGSVTGVLALQRVGEASALCDATRRCPPNAEPSLDASKTFGVVSTVAFGFAAIGAGFAVAALFLKAPSAQPTQPVRLDALQLGPGFLGASGRF
jgi:hypothetical protein